METIDRERPVEALKEKLVAHADPVVRSADAAIQKARRAGDQARQRFENAGERTAERIRGEPIKAILLAAAAGALLTMLLGLRPRR